PDRLSLPFLLLPRPPPRSPLFPYTTLFRSRHVLAAQMHMRPEAVERGVERDGEETRDPIILRIGGNVRARHVAPEKLFAFVDVQDRKSTRLNSSHVSISYAVFCLKKKKKQR